MAGWLLVSIKPGLVRTRNFSVAAYAIHDLRLAPISLIFDERPEPDVHVSEFSITAELTTQLLASAGDPRFNRTEIDL